VLNFFGSVWLGFTGFPIVAVQGSACPYEILRLAFTGAPKPASLTETRPYRHFSGNFDPEWFKRSPIVQRAFEKADGFLKDEGEEKLRERFLTAMKWAGKGSTTVDPDDSFLFFALALEALILGGKQRGGLQYRLALRVAHLLGSTKQEKSMIRDYVKQLYRLRSMLVHTGKAEIPDSDSGWLRTMTLQSILKLMSGETPSDISTDDALENWFEDTLMNCPNI
jgi:hypothetical protein